MKNATTQTMNSTKLKEQAISLDEAYAQSAAQDKLINQEFAAVLNDGLVDESAFQTVKNILSKRS